MRRLCFSLILWFSASQVAYSQTDTLHTSQPIFSYFKDSWDWGMKLGFGNRGKGISPSWELGLMKYHYSSPYGVAIVGISNEFVERNSLFNPKVSAELSFVLIGARISLIDYHSSGLHEIRFRPELGFSLMGLGTIFYGYDLKLNNTGYDAVPIHRLYFNINIPFRKF